jgi:hypothetical protein
MTHSDTFGVQLMQECTDLDRLLARLATASPATRQLLALIISSLEPPPAVAGDASSPQPRSKPRR